MTKMIPRPGHAIVAIVTSEEQELGSGLVRPAIKPGQERQILNDRGGEVLDERGKPKYDFRAVQALEFATVYGLVFYSSIEGIPNAVFNGNPTVPTKATVILLPHVVDDRGGRLFVPIQGDAALMKTGDQYIVASEKIIAVLNEQKEWVPWHDRVMIEPDPQPEKVGPFGIILPDSQIPPMAWAGRIVGIGTKVRESVAYGDRVTYALRAKLRGIKDNPNAEDIEVSTVVECSGGQGKRHFVREEHVLAVL